MWITLFRWKQNMYWTHFSQKLKLSNVSNDFNEMHTFIKMLERFDHIAWFYSGARARKTIPTAHIIMYMIWRMGVVVASHTMNQLSSIAHRNEMVCYLLCLFSQRTSGHLSGSRLEPFIVCFSCVVCAFCGRNELTNAHVAAHLETQQQQI